MDGDVLYFDDGRTWQPIVFSLLSEIRDRVGQTLVENYAQLLVQDVGFRPALLKTLETNLH